MKYSPRCPQSEVASPSGVSCVTHMWPAHPWLTVAPERNGFHRLHFLGGPCSPVSCPVDRPCHILPDPSGPWGPLCSQLCPAHSAFAEVRPDGLFQSFRSPPFCRRSELWNELFIANRMPARSLQKQFNILPLTSVARLGKGSKQPFCWSCFPSRSKK